MAQKCILARWIVVCLALPILVGPSLGAEQAISKKSYCAQVNGKLMPSPYKASGSLPYICVYPDRYDQRCKRKLDDSAYYDIAQRKCVSEFLCDEYNEC